MKQIRWQDWQISVMHGYDVAMRQHWSKVWWTSGFIYDHQGD